MPGDQGWEDEDLLAPTRDPRAAKPTKAELADMRRRHETLKSLQRKVRESQRQSQAPRFDAAQIDMTQLQETFKNMGTQMVRAGKAATEAMGAMMQVALAPHKGGWVESVGWCCEVCGAESMDLELLREVPCGRGD